MWLVKFPVRIVKAIIHIKPKQLIKNTSARVYHLVTFMLLLITYLFQKVSTWLLSLPLINKVGGKIIPVINKVCDKIYKFSSRGENSINRINLIQIAIKNMQFKPARTFITIGGMAVGIAAIVFLVSLGYGLQNLVITRVARLEELKQVDVVPQVGSQLSITDETIANFQQIPNVKHVLPLIGVVGRVNYQNSVSDVAVFGVTSEYLRQSAVQPVRGKIFESDEISNMLPSESGEGVPQVAGAKTEAVELGAIVGDINFAIEPGKWLRVRSAAAVAGEIIGYTRRVEGNTRGILVYGERYDSDDESGEVAQDQDANWLGHWVEAPVYLWQQTGCDPETISGCEEGGYEKIKDEAGIQKQDKGYMAKIFMIVEPYRIARSLGSVLGTQDVLQATDETTGDSETVVEATDSAELSDDTEPQEASGSGLVVVEGEDGFVQIASESGEDQEVVVKTIALGDRAKREAIVNRAMLQIMGMNEENAIGQEFEATFVVTGDLLAAEESKVESAPATYKIVGVDPDEEAPFFYVPFLDLRTLGIQNYSQLKVVANSQDDVDKIRASVEAAGYATTSVQDTVAQIDSLFATVRLILGAIGMVALSVAGLGMFNTMSVSLLERTREVGLMKAMGMRSHEVRELFLTESMTMGFFGGLLGVVLGVGFGKVLSALISIVAISRGVGVVDISHLPLSFSAFIMFLSVVVGLVTGMYPARRATKISALDALRYE